MRMIISFLFILLAIVGGVATAQTLPVFCGDLSDDDCALLTETAQAMADLESVIFHMDMRFAISGIPEPTMNSITININGDGALAMDTEALGALFVSPEAMMENIEELPQMFEQAMGAISADVTLLIEIPEEVIVMYALPRGWQGIDLARFNNAPLITAPEDANIYPLDLMRPDL